MKKIKCSICNYYLPKEMFYNNYSKGFYKICNKCLHTKIHEYMQEIKRTANVNFDEKLIDANENHIPFLD